MTVNMTMIMTLQMLRCMEVLRTTVGKRLLLQLPSPASSSSSSNGSRHPSSREGAGRSLPANEPTRVLTLLAAAVTALGLPQQQQHQQRVEVCIRCQEVPPHRDSNIGTEALPQPLLLLLAASNSRGRHTLHLQPQTTTLGHPTTTITTSQLAWGVTEVAQAQMGLSQTDQLCMAVRSWVLLLVLLVSTACMGEASHPWLWLLLLLLLAT
jgi:hypothetical protein